MALYLDDLHVGSTFQSKGRTVTQADIINFAGVSGDFNELHTNAEWVVTQTPFTAPIAHGLLVLSMSSGLATPGLDSLQIIAYLNVERRMVAPTYAGDTIYLTQEIVEVRPSRSNNETGVVTVAATIKKGNGTVVQAGNDTLLVASRRGR